MTADFPIPAGFALVPLEPTEAMIEAAKDERIACFKDTALRVGAALARIYKAAIAAAPPIAAVVGEPVASEIDRLTAERDRALRGEENFRAQLVVVTRRLESVNKAIATDPAAVVGVEATIDEDTKRLDWLEAHPSLVVYSRSMECWKMPGAFEASTAREAIDTVMKDMEGAQ